MYSERKVAERIRVAESTFHFTPSYHSTAEVDEFESHLVSHSMYRYDDLGQPNGTQSLTDHERQWMLNEQILCMSDAVYFLTRYAFIKNEENIIERFQFRVPQKLLFSIISTLEEGNRTLEIMILKARQLGCSTLVELLISHRIFFAHGVNAILGSADQTKTSLMANMMFLCYDRMPFWLKPKYTRRVESDRGMLVFGHTNSGVSFQHGTQTSGIARGTTPTVYHLSEVASYSDALNQIESSLFRCVHPSPNVFGILESSGEGDKGWWPDTWRSSRDHWARGGARLCPLFLPWFCGIELYPDHQWITYDHPIPLGWRPNTDTRKHVAKAELYVRSMPLLLKHLGRNGEWRMPLEQQWFWEFGHEEAKRKGTESKWYQEMCSDDEEALQRSVESAFGHEVIAEIDTRRVKEYQAFGLAGQSIEAAHEIQPEYVDYSRERIPVRYSNIRGQTYRWELVPLKPHSSIRETVAEDAAGILFIFHPPAPGVSYSIGVDTSGGTGNDSTAISVWTYGTADQPDVQVAEFASPYVNHVEAFAFVMCLAAYYGRYMERGVTRWKEPYVSIEQIASVGDTCQGQMQKMGYSNMHKFVRLDTSLSKMRSRKRGPGARVGWYSTGWSRPILTKNFVHAAKNSWAHINSPWLIEEMKTWEVTVTKSGKQKLEHEEGSHDDRIFSAAMAIFCPHDLDDLAERSKKRHMDDPSVLPPIDVGDYQSTYSVSSSASGEKSVSNLEDVLYSDRELDRFAR